jgi:hypothetical protein
MARTHRLSTTGALIICMVGSQWSGTLFAREEDPSSSATPSSQPVVNSVSEGQGRTSTSATAALPAGDQPVTATELPPSTVERSRFTLKDEIFAANAPLGGASAQPWRSFTFVPAESSSFAQWGYRGRGRGGRHGAAQAEIVLGAVASIAGAAVLVYANRPECSANHLAGGCGYGTKVVGGAVLSVGIVSLLIGALTWR